MQTPTHSGSTLLTPVQKEYHMTVNNKYDIYCLFIFSLFSLYFLYFLFLVILWEGDCASLAFLFATFLTDYYFFGSLYFQLMLISFLQS